MGLIETVTSELLMAAGMQQAGANSQGVNAGKANLLGGIFDMVNQAGLSNFVHGLEDNGIAGAVLSCVSTRENPPIGGDPIQQAVGIARIAQEANSGYCPTRLHRDSRNSCRT